MSRKNKNKTRDPKVEETAQAVDVPEELPSTEEVEVGLPVEELPVEEAPAAELPVEEPAEEAPSEPVTALAEAAEGESAPVPAEAPSAPEAAVPAEPQTAPELKEIEVPLVDLEERLQDPEREQLAFLREVDRLTETDPDFRKQVEAISQKHQTAMYVEVRQLVAGMGAKQQLIKPPARYKVVEPVRVVINGAIRDLKAGEVLSESTYGQAALATLRAEPRVKLKKLVD